MKRSGQVYLGLLRRTSLVLGAIIVFLVAAQAVAFAEHSADHRFQVVGTVKDADGKPFPNEKVTVLHEKSQQELEVTTDGSGRYTAGLHLHNTDLGDTITVSVKGAEASIEVEFDRDDTTTVRTGKTNLVIKDRKAPDPPAPLTQRPSTYLVAGALLAGVAGAFVISGRTRRKRLEARREERRKQRGKGSRKKGQKRR